MSVYHTHRYHDMKIIHANLLSKNELFLCFRETYANNIRIVKAKNDNDNNNNELKLFKVFEINKIIKIKTFILNS